MSDTDGNYPRSLRAIGHQYFTTLQIRYGNARNSISQLKLH